MSTVATAARPKAKAAPKAKAKTPTSARHESTDRRRFMIAANSLKMLGDATRLHVLHVIAEQERHVGDLCGAIGMSQPALSHHLALLRHGGLVMPRREGKHNFYGLTDKGRSILAATQAVLAD